MVGESRSLYRAYRPRSFDDGELVGQETVARTLRNAIINDRVAHAYLFCGPRGTGKTSTARLLARAVNCEHADPVRRPCGECRACKVIGQGENHSMDIIEIDAASNRGIDDIRELRDRIGFSPSELRCKFYIIDEVHQLSEAAANALLKTLEEPPPHARFVLATTDPQKMLETIVSRCQVFRFRRIPLEQMVGRLRHVCAAEGLDADDAALALLARRATGSMRDALGLLDRMVAYTGERLTVDLVRQALGVQGDEPVIALVDAVLANDLGAALNLVSNVTEAGYEARQFASEVVDYLRELLLRMAGGRTAVASFEPVREEAQRRQAASADLASVADLVQRLSEIDFALERGPYGALPLELALVETRLAREAATRAPQAVVAAVTPTAPVAPTPRPVAKSTGEAPPSIEEARPQPVAAPAAELPVPAAGIDAVADDVQALWAKVDRDMRAHHRQIHALLREARPSHVEGDTFVIVATYPFHQERLSAAERRTVIEESVGRHLGRAVKLRVVLADGSGAAPAPVADETLPSPPVPVAERQPAPQRRSEAREEPPRVEQPRASSPPDDDDVDRRRVQAAANIFSARRVNRPETGR